MKKFAFLTHLGSSYRQDFQMLASPLGWIPDAVYRLALRNRPLAPFVWSDVSLTPNATGPDGHIIMLPYTGRQLAEQQGAMLPLITKALALAASKGAEVLGLGGLTSVITQDGKRVADNSHMSVTNGYAYTALITCQRIAQLLRECHKPKPVVALVGATGCPGTLIGTFLAKNHNDATYLLIARNNHQTHRLAADMRTINTSVELMLSHQLDDIKQADIVVLLTSDADYMLQPYHLKTGAIVIDNAQPRNTQPSLVTKRPDVTVIDGGLVATPAIHFRQRPIGLPNGISYACLAETILLAQVHHPDNFSVGNTTLAQVDYIRRLAQRFSHLSFDLAPDHSFGKPIFRRAIVARKIQTLRQPRFSPIAAAPSVSFS